MSQWSRSCTLMVSATAVMACLFVQQGADAQTTPLTTRIVGSGFSRPLFVTAPPGDNNRIFVVEQRGLPISTSARIMIIDLTTNPPTTLATPFLTVTGLSTANEQGLLGFAFAPDYATSGRFYVNYTNPNTRIARGTVSADPNVANSTLTNVLTVNQPFNNHNGGWIGFGPDNYLYIGMGDGGSEYDPQHNGQNLNTLLSKILRIDVSGAGYTIPPGNPYAGGGAVPELFYWGVRNPWRDSFDRATGDLYIGDVGQDTYEEIDIAPAGSSGLNFGWSCMEANHCCTTCSTPTGCTCAIGCPNGSGLTCPVAEYTHGTRCSVTGGYVYRGPKIPDWQGQYFLADYCSNNIYTMPAGGGALTDRTSMLVPTLPSPAAALTSITSFGEGASGEIYICSQGGRIARIEVNCAGASKSFTTQPAPQTVCQGGSAMFMVAVSGIRGAVTYDWRRNGTSIGAPSSPTLNLTHLGPGSAGSYDVVVTDQCGSITSNAATLTVNTPGPGDENADCSVDLLDLPIFVDVLLGNDVDSGHVARADVNGDTLVNGDDIGPFSHLVAP